MSVQCARLTAIASSSPSWKIGSVIVTSGVCVPPW
jgi:hypothetical protein